MKQHNPLLKLTAGICSAAFMLTAAPLNAYAAPAAATAAEAIRNAWENFDSTISLSRYKLSIAEASQLYYDALYTESDWFYVNSSFSYSTTLFGGYVDKIAVKYYYDTDKVPSMRKELDDRIAEIIAGIHPAWSDAEKVLYLHDTVIDNCEYDFSYTYADAYAALVSGCAVCQGYALAMNLLCREAGIPCYSLTCDSLNHIWNVVQIDGAWYFPDFQLLHPETYELIFIEHLGMMDNADYVKSNMTKICKYAQNGLVPEKNFFFTWETSENPLTPQDITLLFRRIGIMES